MQQVARSDSSQSVESPEEHSKIKAFKYDKQLSMGQLFKSEDVRFNSNHINYHTPKGETLLTSPDKIFKKPPGFDSSKSASRISLKPSLNKL